LIEKRAEMSEDEVLSKWGSTVSHPWQHSTESLKKRSKKIALFSASV